MNYYTLHYYTVACHLPRGSKLNPLQLALEKEKTQQNRILLGVSKFFKRVCVGCPVKLMILTCWHLGNLDSIVICSLSLLGHSVFLQFHPTQTKQEVYLIWHKLYTMFSPSMLLDVCDHILKKRFMKQQSINPV